MEGIELVSFTIIACAGTARSLYIEAIRQAKVQAFIEADSLMDEGEKMFIEGHAAHVKLIQEEADGHKSEYALLLVHAEDQLMSAEAFGILAREFIDIYKRLV